MSDNYIIKVIGREDFVLPFALMGIEHEHAKDQKMLIGLIEKADIRSTVFIVEEDILDKKEEIELLETERGAHLLIMKAWGKSSMAENKIRMASIKAIGMDLT